jgi:transcriptional regulator with XRE-family HTH domain
MKTATGFGTQLKRWRASRGKSQLELSMIAGYSQRHVSFLESGRSQPSRATVITLAEALDVPVRERNSLLQAAGYAPVYGHEPLDSATLHPALTALETVVQSHRPFPAIVVDRGWNMLAGNDNAFALFQRFLDTPLTFDPARPMNAMRACIDPHGMRRYIVGWDAFAASLLVSLRHELAFEGDNADLAALIEAIETDPEFRPSNREPSPGIVPPVATLSLARDGFRVDLFTLLSTFATANDATLSELRVETFFPADDASRAGLLRLDAELNAVAPQRAASGPVAVWRRTG